MIRSDTMTTATLRFSTALPETRSKSRKGFFARFHAALVEARMRAAMREIALHRHLIPEDVVKTSGYTATLANDGAYPFTK
jgi:hypothetical protein